MPEKNKSETIRKGDFVLLDIWCKKKEAKSVYADITRVGIAGPSANEKQEKIFGLVKKARDKADGVR